jgi:hypothetical protein
VTPTPEFNFAVALEQVKPFLMQNHTLITVNQMLADITSRIAAQLLPGNGRYSWI